MIVAVFQCTLALTLFAIAVGIASGNTVNAFIAWTFAILPFLATSGIWLLRNRSKD